MNIPVYRAKVLDGDKYVEGYLDYSVGSGSIKESYFINNQRWHDDIGYDSLQWEIDPTTLSISFSNMLDSEGNKIFASLSEDGKGGDIIHRDGMTFETIYKSVNGRFEAYEINGMHHLLAHKFHQTKITGIQQ